mgnify:FL=1
MLYTRKGDDGTSGLFNTKERFPKNSPIYEALGALDELNSLLGVCRAYSGSKSGEVNVALEVKNVQECLFIVQAELAGASKSMLPTHTEKLELTIGKIETLIENRHTFVIPGSTKLSALFDYVRAVSRRTERAVLDVRAIRNISIPTRTYLNRLSSFLYALARYAAVVENAEESSPSYL